ncbi:hypothetical protein WISP_98420 [Willisornis vidua]|uniref:Uncharacterized protein n=1 Tax=Willisornis vidua TaxID=1566151 RepID=A0ABQ9D5C3_9PASS|nr:hypothetical protein WISP_98420 [Willisornis vidua]
MPALLERGRGFPAGRAPAVPPQRLLCREDPRLEPSSVRSKESMPPGTFHGKRRLKGVGEAALVGSEEEEEEQEEKEEEQEQEKEQEKRG